MKLSSYLFYKKALVVNLLLTIITFSSNALAEEREYRRAESYRTQCSFYGQYQKQAQKLGCSIKQSSSRIIIYWDDGFTTNLILSRQRGWLSMPSESETNIKYYSESGRVAEVEIYEGPGKGIISIDP